MLSFPLLNGSDRFGRASRKNAYMPGSFEPLRIYSVGVVTIVGFGNQLPREPLDLAAVRAPLVQLLQEHNCSILGIDLTGVILIPSGLLGMLVSLRQRGVVTHLYNASADIREVLEITGLQEFFQVHDFPPQFSAPPAPRQESLGS